MTDSLEIAGVSTRGLVRLINEDCASVNGQRLQNDAPYNQTLKVERHILLVADGMGGHARGEIASDIALRTLETGNLNLDSPSACAAALRVANRAVFDAALREPALSGMGATLVGVAIEGRACSWFNVGDSRAYLFRAGALRQLSTDHVPAEDVGPSRKRSHAVTQSLGGTRVFTEVLPAVGSLLLEAGDRLLLCSDGLTDVVDDRQIASKFRSEPICSKLVECMISDCFSQGAPDNVTILCAHFE